MNLLEARVAFRDRSPVDVLDLALRFAVVHWRVFARIAATVLVPALVVSYLVARAWGWGAAWAVAIPAGFAARLPFTILASRLAFEDGVRARDVLRAAAREAPRVLAARIAWAVALALAFGLFFAPLLLVGAALVYLDEVLVLERQPITRAFSRAASVASSSYGEAIFAVTILALLAVAGVGLAELGGRTTLAELLQVRPPPSAFVEGGSVLCLVGWFGLVPYLATARFFSYLNVRTRVEGWDIQTRFASIRSRLTEEGEEREAA